MVFFFDERRFGLHSSIGRCWARKGVRVSAPVNPNYQNFSVYSGVSPLTGDAFSLFSPWVNTEMMNPYLTETLMNLTATRFMELCKCSYLLQ
jgi:hypothetical protein